MQTLLLDNQAWDLCLDANGNIALASEPYAIAQDVASALRLFLGELFYDTTKGVPYWQRILGERPPLTLLKAQFERAALTVPDVLTATALITTFKNRSLSGQVQITYTIPATQAAPVASVGVASIYIVGDNGGVVVFVGDNGGVVSLTGGFFNGRN